MHLVLGVPKLFDLKMVVLVIKEFHGQQPPSTYSECALALISYCCCIFCARITALHLLPSHFRRIRVRRSTAEMDDVSLKRFLVFRNVIKRM